MQPRFSFFSVALTFTPLPFVFSQNQHSFCFKFHMYLLQAYHTTFFFQFFFSFPSPWHGIFLQELQPSFFFHETLHINFLRLFLIFLVLQIFSSLAVPTFNLAPMWPKPKGVVRWWLQNGGLETPPNLHLLFQIGRGSNFFFFFFNCKLHQIFSFSPPKFHL